MTRGGRWCWIGRHFWRYDDDFRWRTCRDCGRVQFWWVDAFGKGWKP